MAGNIKTYFHYIHIAAAILGENSFGSAEVGDYVERLWDWPNPGKRDKLKHLTEQMHLLRAALNEQQEDFRNPWAQWEEAGTVTRKRRRILDDSDEDEVIAIKIQSPAIASTSQPMTPPDSQLRMPFYAPGPSQYVNKSIPSRFQAEYQVDGDVVLDTLFAGSTSECGSNYGSGSGSGFGNGSGSALGIVLGLTPEQWNTVE